MKLPEHEHTHSLFVHCLECFMFGTPMPHDFVNIIEATECGNCGSMHTVKYYPGCCLISIRDSK